MEPEKEHSTGEFVIVAKFGGYLLRHLASRLANVIRRWGLLLLLLLFYFTAHVYRLSYGTERNGTMD